MGESYLLKHAMTLTKVAIPHAMAQSHFGLVREGPFLSRHHVTEFAAMDEL